MPGNWGRDSQLRDEFATTSEGERGLHSPGHDRIHGDNLIPGTSSTIAMSGDNEDIDVEITAGQKMISAMSGSLLTSVLGKRIIPLKLFNQC